MSKRESHYLDKFPECSGCINRKFDPFQCQECVNGSRFEAESTDVYIEDITYDNFLDLMRISE